MNSDQEEKSNFQEHHLHRLGGIAAILIAVLLIGELLVYAVLPNPSTAVDCIEMFNKNHLVGLLHFDLLGMISYVLFIPVMLSIFQLLRKQNEAIMLSATVLFFIGIAVFFATNTSFSMLSVSKQYALAETEMERTMLLSSYQTLLTIFNVQAFMISYVLVSLAWIMIGVVMLGSKVFSRFIASTGILAGASGILAEIIENAIGSWIYVAIGFYFLAIVFLFLWILSTGRRLLQQGSRT